MKLKIKRINYFLLSCVLLTAVTDSSARTLYTQLNHFEGIGALGIANLGAENGNIGITSSETDKLVQTNSNNWRTFNGQVGAGYVIYFEQRTHTPRSVQWFPAIEPQLNLYYLNSNSAIQGNVWRYGSPAYNQLNYRIPFQSTRLMLDVALTMVKKGRSSLYIKSGLGNAWNRTGYSDSINNASTADCLSEQLNLSSSQWRSNFAWEVGVGALHDFNNNVGVSLEYLYTDFGTVKSAAHGSYAITTPATFSLHAQTVALGLHFGV